MASVNERIVKLAGEEAAYVDALVAQGRYATSNDVVKAGLSALQERDAAIERWLQHDVVPVAREMQVHPERSIAVDDVFEDIKRLHSQRIKSAGNAL